MENAGVIANSMMLRTIIEAIERINTQNIFVIDYDTHDLIYKSRNLIFVDESEDSDIRRVSYNPYWALVPDEVFEKLMILQNNYLLFLKDISEEDLGEHVCIIDFPITVHNHSLFVTQKSTPLQLRNEVVKKYALFEISYSTRRKIECVIRFSNGRSFNFDFSLEKFVENTVGFNLSKREWAIFRRIKKGFTNREIADGLCISENTVKTHKKRIFTKLGVTSATEAIAAMDSYFLNK